MNLVSIHDELNFEKIYNFCKKSNSDDSPAAKNMSVEDWENNHASLLNTIYIQKRFDKSKKAGYWFVEEDNCYIAGSGCYPLDTDGNISILGVRTYTLIEYRSKLLHGNLILPKQQELSEQLEYKSLILTFNEYNLWLLKGVESLSSGRGKIIGNRIPNFYKSWNKLDFKIAVKYTEQWCMYKHIDETYHDSFMQSMADIRSD
jgi:hypothetical protein